MREITTHQHADLPPSELTIEAFGPSNFIVQALNWDQTVLRFLGTEPGTHALLTNEVLIAIVMDRLEQFQAGEHPCHENAQALVHLRDAMDALHGRELRARGAATQPELNYEGPDHDGEDA